jgi:NitT/TauT family transport system substrate-binding protein
MNTSIIAGLLIISLIMLGSTYYYLSEEPNIIKVGYLPGDHHAALFAAKELKMFEKEGLDVQLVPFNSGTDLVEALEQGKIDIGYCGITPVTMAIDKGVSLKIVAPVNLEGSGIIVSKKSNITRPKDLSGKKVAIPHNGSVQELLLHIYLEDNKVDPSTLNYLTEEVPMMPLGLKEGSFDAYIAWEPFVSESEDYGFGDVLLESQNIWPHHPCCVVVVKDEFIKNRPLTLSKFLKVHVSATNYINKYPEKNIIFLSKKIGTLSDLELEGLAHVEYIALPDFKYEENLLKMVQLQKHMDYIKNNLTLNQIADFSYLPGL